MDHTHKIKYSLSILSDQRRWPAADGADHSYEYHRFFLSSLCVCHYYTFYTWRLNNNVRNIVVGEHHLEGSRSALRLIHKHYSACREKNSASTSGRRTVHQKLRGLEISTDAAYWERIREARSECRTNETTPIYRHNKTAICPNSAGDRTLSPLVSVLRANCMASERARL